MVKDINVVATGACSNPSSFSVQNKKLFIIAIDGINGNEPWQSEGNSADTSMVADLYSGIVDGVSAILQ